MKHDSHTLLENSGPLQASTGIASPLLTRSLSTYNLQYIHIFFLYDKTRMLIQTYVNILQQTGVTINIQYTINFTKMFDKNTQCYA